MTLIAILLPMVVTGCGGRPADEPPEEAPAAIESVLTEAEMDEARGLYEGEACSLCHGQTADGVPDMGPPLRELAPYWDEDRLSAYLNDPEGFRGTNPDFDDRRPGKFEMEMPAFDHLPPEQRELLARWLLTR